MYRYQLTRSAERDLRNIALYTIQQFGVRQAQIYRDGLLKAFQMLAEFPHIGSDQGQIKANVRRHVHASHSIYYRVEQKKIVILRILSPGEDPLRQRI